MRTRLPCFGVVAALAATAVAAAEPTSTVYFVKAVAVVGSAVAVEAEDLEAGALRRLRLEADDRLVDLATAQQAAAGRLTPGMLLFTGEGGKPSMLLLAGKRVHEDLARKDAGRAAALDKLSAAFAEKARLLSKASAAAAKAAGGSPASGELDAFIFVLELGLGAPFNVAQEEEIRKAALSGGSGGWSFEGYSKLVPVLMRLDEAQRSEMQATLEATIREWLETSDPKDPAVRTVRAHLVSRGKVVAPGTPPLTEMAATAFAELYAFSQLLAQDPEASPSRIDPGEVAALRKQAIDRWSSFSPREREAVAAVPGRWVVLRRVLDFGTGEERARVRASIREIGTGGSSPGAARPHPSATTPTRKALDAELARRQTAHWISMQMQQMTFNHYMWSRGFSYHPTAGKMW